MKLFATTLTAALIAATCTACMPSYSTGSRTGVVTKLSEKGLIFKSWEGTLNQGGLRNQRDSEGNSSVVANVLDFNIKDPAVVAQVQEALNSGARVELTYKQWFIKPPTIDNKHVVTGVKVSQ